MSDRAPYRSRPTTLLAAALLLVGGLAVLPAGEPDRGRPDAVADVFRGSPAASWADGAAGIVLPEARAVAGMSTSQVAAALRAAREFLVAANLRPATFGAEGHQPALYLIDPYDGVRDDYQGRLDRPDAADRDPMVLFTRFDPAEARPAGTPKVRGTLTYAAGEESGTLEIRARYTFVYPMADALPGRDRTVRVVMRRDITFAAYDPGTWDTLPGTLTPLEHTYALANVDCGAFDGVAHPWFLGGGPPEETREIDRLPLGCSTYVRA